MWHQNPFGNNGAFPNGFDNQNESPTPSFPNGFHPFLPSNMMPYEDDNGAHFNNMNPDAGPYNQASFAQNQQSMNADVQSSPPAFIIPQLNSIPRPVLDARTAELRERLMKGREARGNSATPPVARAVNPLLQAAAALSKSPLADHQTPAQDLHELISSFSDSPPAAPNESTKPTNISTSFRAPSGTRTSAKSQEPSSGSPTKAASELSTNGNTGGNDLTSNIGSRHASHGLGSASEISEGEILEDVVMKEANQLPAEGKRSAERAAAIAKPIKTATPEFRDAALPNTQYRDQREAVPSQKAPPSNPKAPSQRSREDLEDPEDSREYRQPDRFNGFDKQPERRPFQSESRYERSSFSESDKRPFARRDSHDEEYRRAEGKVERRDEKQQVLQSRTPPILEKVLPHDRDLREWLDITGYHVFEYRNKILNRRRQIAKLDAKRARLVAEMTEEERGGVPRPNQSMFPPPFPPRPAAFEPLSTPTPATREAQREVVGPNKRTYSEIHDSEREAGGAEKMPRLEDRGRSGERVLENRNSRSRAGSGNRPFSDRRDDRDLTYSRYEDKRPRRSQSRDRDESPLPPPGRRGQDSRPALARTRSFDEMRDYDGPRGNQGFNSSYQGKGRGRGRGRGGGGGKYQGHNNNNDPPSGPRGANGKPYKDAAGFDKGRGGGGAGQS